MREFISKILRVLPIFLVGISVILVIINMVSSGDYLMSWQELFNKYFLPIIIISGIILSIAIAIDESRRL